ncbi:MAG TPA: alpha/beta hydrolase [Aquihabitans sp.]|jgi:pimeloyl-ACP methyl ester carboxylesterase|nr:alpha/beta hydrolase [Aquihabitans sp.]
MADAAGAAAATARVDVGGVELAVAESGRGGRPLLLVHGFTGAKEDFADWMGRFADDGWWVLAPDLRGHGASSQPADEASYSLATFATDLWALVDHAGWDRFALLGHSMGGMIAQELVLQHPERVERLVLMDTDGGPARGIDAETVAFGVEVLRTQGLPALLALIDQLPTPPRSPAEERLRATRPGFAEWCDAKLRASAPAMYAAMALELTSRPDRLPELAGLDVPTRVVVGEQDRDFLGGSRRLAEAIPGADLVVVPDAAHSPQLENPVAWWEAVGPWLAAR